MARPSLHAKSRVESLDVAIKTAAQREAFYEFVVAHTVEEAIVELRDRYGVTRKKTAIYDWAEKVRGEKDFREELERIRIAQQRSEQMVDAIADQTSLDKSLAMALKTAFLDAQIAQDDKAMKGAAARLFFVLSGLAKEKDAGAKMIAATTAQEKFQFDAARAARAHAKEILAIDSSKGSEHEKLSRIVDKMFGQRPPEK